MVRGNGCFYKTAVTSEGDRVTWRVFLPWEERSGGRCLNRVPKELWAVALLTGPLPPGLPTPTMDVAAVLVDVASAGHLKRLTVSTFLGESGPSATGKTMCGAQFTSEDACYVCNKVHSEPFNLVLTRYRTHIL